MSTEAIASTDAIFWKSKTFNLPQYLLFCIHIPSITVSKNANGIKLSYANKKSNHNHENLIYGFEKIPNKRENTETFLSYRFIKWETIRINKKWFCTWFTLLLLRMMKHFLWLNAFLSIVFSSDLNLQQIHHLNNGNVILSKLFIVSTDETEN